VEDLLLEAIEKARKLPKLVVESSAPSFFVGDLHGDPSVIPLARELLETGHRVIFLGDYADRGIHQRETIQGVLELFLEGAILLRGNHEVGSPSSPRYVGPVYPYDVVRFLTPSELLLYERLHELLPVIYYAPPLLAVHGFLPSNVIRSLPRVEVTPSLEFQIVWSDSDPFSTSLRGVSVDNPSLWKLSAVEKALEERDLFLLKGHSPHELRGKRRGLYRRVAVLFGHCHDTGGYYRDGVRYALFDGELRFFEQIPCSSHRELLRTILR